MTEEFIANAIANIGVPTALCFYCLFSLNKSVNKLADKFDNLADKMDKGFEKFDKVSDRINLLIESVRSLENEFKNAGRH